MICACGFLVKLLESFGLLISFLSVELLENLQVLMRLVGLFKLLVNLGKLVMDVLVIGIQHGSFIQKL